MGSPLGPGAGRYNVVGWWEVGADPDGSQEEKHAAFRVTGVHATGSFDVICHVHFGAVVSFMKSDSFLILWSCH